MGLGRWDEARIRERDLYIQGGNGDEGEDSGRGFGERDVHIQELGPEYWNISGKNRHGHNQGTHEAGTCMGIGRGGAINGFNFNTGDTHHTHLKNQQKRMYCYSSVKG